MTARACAECGCVTPAIWYVDGRALCWKCWQKRCDAIAIANVPATWWRTTWQQGRLL
jgi:hypothetical protein